MPQATVVHPALILRLLLCTPISADIDQHPEMQVFRKCFLDEKPLSERQTLTLNKKPYYYALHDDQSA